MSCLPFSLISLVLLEVVTQRFKPLMLTIRFVYQGPLQYVVLLVTAKFALVHVQPVIWPSLDTGMEEVSSLLLLVTAMAETGGEASLTRTNQSFLLNAEMWLWHEAKPKALVSLFFLLCEKMVQLLVSGVAFKTSIATLVRYFKTSIVDFAGTCSHFETTNNVALIFALKSCRNWNELTPH